MLVYTLYRIAFEKLSIDTNQYTAATNVRFTGFSACSALSHKKKSCFCCRIARVVPHVLLYLFSDILLIHLTEPDCYYVSFSHTSPLQHHPSISLSIFFHFHSHTFAWSGSTNNSHFFSVHGLPPSHISFVSIYSAPTYRTYLICLLPITSWCGIIYISVVHTAMQIKVVSVLHC